MEAVKSARKMNYTACSCLYPVIAVPHPTAQSCIARPQSHKNDSALSQTVERHTRQIFTVSYASLWYYMDYGSHT